jgi:hypothetical protein
MVFVGYFNKAGLNLNKGSDFPLHHHNQTSSGANPASYPMCTEDYLPVNKVATA